MPIVGTDCKITDVIKGSPPSQVFFQRLRKFNDGKADAKPGEKPVRQILIKIAKILEEGTVNEEDLKASLHFIQYLEQIDGGISNWLKLGVTQLLEKVLTKLSTSNSYVPKAKKELLYEFYDTITMITTSASPEGKELLRNTVVPCLLGFACQENHCIPSLVEGVKVVNSLLQCCSVSSLRQLSSNTRVSDNLMAMGKKIAVLGDMELQMGFVEGIFRLTSPDERQHIGNHCFHYQSIVDHFLNIKDTEFEPDCRKFLNSLNASSSNIKRVVTLPCTSAYVGDIQLQKPNDKDLTDFWVDFNPRSSSMTIFIQDSAVEKDMWDTVAVNKDNVKSYVLAEGISQGHQLTIQLSEALAHISSSHQVKVFFKNDYDPRTALYQVFGKDLEKTGSSKKRANRMSIAIASLLISGGKTTISESPVNSAVNSQASPPVQASPEVPRQTCATPDLTCPVKTPKTSTPTNPLSQRTPHSNLPRIAQATTHLPSEMPGYDEEESPIVSSAPMPIPLRGKECNNARDDDDMTNPCQQKEIVEENVRTEFEPVQTSSKDTVSPENTALGKKDDRQKVFMLDSGDNRESSQEQTHEERNAHPRASKQKNNGSMASTVKPVPPARKASKKPTSRTKFGKIPSAGPVIGTKGILTTTAPKVAATKQNKNDKKKMPLSPFGFPEDDSDMPVLSPPEPKGKHLTSKRCRKRGSTAKRRPNKADQAAKKKKTECKPQHEHQELEYDEPLCQPHQRSPSPDTMHASRKSRRSKASTMKSIAECLDKMESPEKDNSTTEEQEPQSPESIATPQCYEPPVMVGWKEDYECQAVDESKEEDDEIITSSVPSPPRSTRDVTHDGKLGGQLTPQHPSPVSQPALSPCSVRLQRHSVSLTTPLQDPIAVTNFQETASSILEDFSASMLDVVATVDRSYQTETRTEMEDLCPAVTSTVKKPRRGKKRDLHTHNDSPVQMTPKPSVRPISSPSPTINQDLESGWSAPTTPCHTLHSDRSGDSQNDYFTSTTVSPPKKQKKKAQQSPVNHDSGLGTSYFRFSPLRFETTSPTTSSGYVRHPLTTEKRKSCQSRKRDRSVDYNTDYDERRETKRRKAIQAPSQQEPRRMAPLNRRSEPFRRTYVDEGLSQEAIQESEHDSPLLQPLGQLGINGSDVQSLVQSFGAGMSQSFQSKKRILNNFSRNIANHAAGLIDKFWDDVSHERSQVMSNFGQSVSPHFILLEKELEAGKQAQDKIVATMKECIAALESTRRAQQKSLSGLRQEVSEHVDSMQSLMESHSNHKVAMQRSLLARSRREQERLEQQLAKMQVEQVRKSLQASIMQV